MSLLFHVLCDWIAYTTVSALQPFWNEVVHPSHTYTCTHIHTYTHLYELLKSWCFLETETQMSRSLWQHASIHLSQVPNRWIMKGEKYPTKLRNPKKTTITKLTGSRNKIQRQVHMPSLGTVTEHSILGEQKEDVFWE